MHQSSAAVSATKRQSCPADTELHVSCAEHKSGYVLFRKGYDKQFDTVTADNHLRFMALQRSGKGFKLKFSNAGATQDVYTERCAALPDSSAAAIWRLITLGRAGEFESAARICGAPRLSLAHPRNCRHIKWP